jgi:mono/diheme cytochrome c family protein
MSLQFVSAILVPAFTVGMLAAAGAQQPFAAAEKFDLGKHEYESSCAICHGLTGKGDGPFASYLEKGSIVDLTALAKKNNGVFPFTRVYETIDGTQLKGAHGNRDMPIWGTRYKIEAAKQSYEYPYDSEAATRARILALSEYLYRLQAK